MGQQGLRVLPGLCWHSAREVASTYLQNVTEGLLSSIHVDGLVPITPSSSNSPQESFGFVEGRVYNQKNGAGVASAEITVDYNPTRIMTDDLGNYRGKVLPAQHSIGAQSSDYSVIPSSVMILPEPNHQTGSESCEQANWIKGTMEVVLPRAEMMAYYPDGDRVSGASS